VSKAVSLLFQVLILSFYLFSLLLSFLEKTIVDAQHFFIDPVDYTPNLLAEAL
jgi:hypothetical protein